MNCPLWYYHLRSVFLDGSIFMNLPVGLVSGVLIVASILMRAADCRVIVIIIIIIIIIIMCCSVPVKVSGLVVSVSCMMAADCRVSPLCTAAADRQTSGALHTPLVSSLHRHIL